MEIIVNDSRIQTWPVGVAILIILMVMSWRRKHSLSHLLCLLMFGAYLMLAIERAFFSIAISGTYVDQMREVPLTSFLNLIPFNFNLTEIPELVYMQIFQNILLTVPFGFGISFVVPLRAKDFIWLVPAVGLGIEGIQLLISLALRYPYRVIDVNDAILNALGVLVGYIIFRIFAWIMVMAMRSLRIQYGGLAAYIYDVTNRASGTN